MVTDCNPLGIYLKVTRRDSKRGWDPDGAALILEPRTPYNQIVPCSRVFGNSEVEVLKVGHVLADFEVGEGSGCNCFSECCFIGKAGFAVTQGLMDALGGATRLDAHALQFKVTTELKSADGSVHFSAKGTYQHRNIGEVKLFFLAAANIHGAAKNDLLARIRAAQSLVAFDNIMEQIQAAQVGVSADNMEVIQEFLDTATTLKDVPGLRKVLEMIKLIVADEELAGDGEEAADEEEASEGAASQEAASQEAAGAPKREREDGETGSEDAQKRAKGGGVST